MARDVCTFPLQELERAKRVVIVVAHPDDEVIGAGGLLPYLHDVWIVHTTDGAPRDMADAVQRGFATREGYAGARRRELVCAMRLARISPDRLVCLDFGDRDTIHCLTALRRRLGEELLRLDPEIVITHPYEGGHPDHDSTAFAAHGVFGGTGRLFEMTSYHSRDGVLETGVFLSSSEPVEVRALRKPDVIRKERMLACFQSQQSVLRDFAVVPEQFRRAPQYDFTRPPHTGVLHYERLPWGITGNAWRAMAARCE